LELAVLGLAFGAVDSVSSSCIFGAVCITGTGDMYIDEDGTCPNT
jgi:hypothetical protein